jgi:steroid 5-alpha reductase family enzyme
MGLLVALAVVFVAATGLWLLSVRLSNVSIADIGWGIGILLCAIVYFVLGDGWLPRRVLVLGLCAVWALRLSLHIGVRNHGKPEDSRYQAFREQFGRERYWWYSYFQTFLLQGALLWVCSLPLFAAMQHTTPAIGLLEWGGVALWAVGFYFETAGDAQLLAFKRDLANKGKLMTTGVWAWTRHPNYFGECVLWWGFGAFALAAGAWWALLGPLQMTYLLTRVSGVAMTEKFMSERPGYAEYVRRTPAFFPRPPR